MHRHTYHGRKLSRTIGPRQALMRNLATSLLLHERIETTLAKAKELVPAVERLITVAKRNNLMAERTLRAQLQTENAARKLMTEIAPAMADRTSGHLRIIKTGTRRGDNAPMAVVSLILPEKIVTETQPKDEAVKTKPAASQTKAAKTTGQKAKPKPKAKEAKA
jgi:large subunit ribosomal protein L17